MISSSVQELPQHLAEVLSACLRQDMYPLTTEHRPFDCGESSLAFSMRLVDAADLYIGIFAHRYGYIPPGAGASITELEYRRACERGIPTLIFIMHEEHLLHFRDVEHGPGGERIRALKASLLANHTVAFFRSPEELRAHVVDGLSQYRIARPEFFHHLRDIPVPPDAYVVHPYTLLRTRGFVGRRHELNLLTDWVASPGSPLADVRVLNVLAIDGMGKSALTWKWFHDIAPHEMRPLAGRIWWSFQEKDALFENFTIRSLAYILSRPREEVARIQAPKREHLLFEALDARPFLIVFDGVERMLNACARQNTIHSRDNGLLDEQVLNAFIHRSGTQPIMRHWLRKTADPRAGAFIRKLCKVRASRVLLISRLLPAAVQSVAGTLLPGAEIVSLRGLGDDDALEIWRSLGASGTQDELRPLFKQLDSHPLLIRILAGELAHILGTPRDYYRWLESNPDLDLSAGSFVQRKNEVFEYVLSGMPSSHRRVLSVLAGLRMPVTYDVLGAIFANSGNAFENESEFDAVLGELEDRGLLGRSQGLNRYYLHPVMRGIIWQKLGRIGRRMVYETLERYFGSLPVVDQQQVRSIDDLTVPIELFCVCIGLQRWEDAYGVFWRCLRNSMQERLNLCRQSAELLEGFFPDGIDRLSPFGNDRKVEHLTHNLAYCYYHSGQVEMALNMMRRVQDRFPGVQSSTTLHNLAVYQSIAEGSLYAPERNLRMALSLTLETSRPVSLVGQAHSAQWLAYLLGQRGYRNIELEILLRCVSVYAAERIQDEHVVLAYTNAAKVALDLGQTALAQDLAEQATSCACRSNHERSKIWADYTRGYLLTETDDEVSGLDLLFGVLSTSRQALYPRAEASCLLQLAHVYQRLNDRQKVQEMLEDVWDPVERGPFAILRIKALVLQARSDFFHGRRDQAVLSAKEALSISWSDGAPYCHRQLVDDSQQLLLEMDESVHNMKPFLFDDTEPMPPVEVSLFEGIDLPEE